MKKIEAIIQPFRFEAVKEALIEKGIDGMTVTDVLGHGRQWGHVEVYRGREYAVDFRPKTKIELVVHDDDCAAVIRTICVAARTGSIGDGKIFVYDIPEVVRIRNQQRNEAALA